MSKYIYISLFYFQIGFSQSQSDSLHIYMDALQSLNFSKSIDIALTNENNQTRKLLELLAKIIEDDRQTKLQFLDSDFEGFKVGVNEAEEQQYLSYLILGYINLNYEKNRVKSFSNFKTSLKIAKEINNINLKKHALNFILKFYLKGHVQANDGYKVYLEEFKNLAITKLDWIYYYSFKYNFLSQTEFHDEKESKKQNLYDEIFIGYDSIANLFDKKAPILSIYLKDKANNILRKNPVLAKELYSKANDLYTDSNYYTFQKYYYLINLSRASSLLNEDAKGLTYLNEAEKYISYNDSLMDYWDIILNKANHFNNLKIYDSAFFYENKGRFLSYKIKFQEENQKVSELETKLETEKKEIENLQLKQDNLTSEIKRKQNQNLFYGALVILMFSVIIYYQSIKSSKRKRLLAEQQKELEQQKNMTLIKEQEITTINAMVDGQEKERIRIAEDLHDNIGSVLATLKLHFENLKLNREKKHFDQDVLYQKTEKLIDETYFKVRSLAHAKNSGVIANKGLLTAVKIMAEKISDANKVAIEVLDYGLEKTLENSLEITVFRIIQELTTNIIKHAEATSATINLSLYDNNFNIIIEDNGKGFVLKDIELKNDGMGLGSIKTRIKHLNGTFDIDSRLGKGASILINIPV